MRRSTVFAYRIPFRAQQTISLLITYVIVGLGAVIMLWPFLWMAFTGLKPDAEILRFPPTLLPQEVTFTNWTTVLDRVPLFPRYFSNSLVMALGLIVGRLIVDCLAAYAFARIEFPGRDIIFLVFLSALMVSSQTLIVPLYIIVSRLGWLNSFQGLIVPGLADAFGIFMLRQFFMGIPHELEDAATIDGCGLLGVLVRIYIPVSIPALVTLSLFSFISGWNSFLWPLLVATKNEWRTVEVGLAILSVSERMNWGMLMAASTMAVIPIIILFMLVQQKLIEGISIAGVRH
jgi:multiple sugar transport system permease protein